MSARSISSRRMRIALVSQEYPPETARGGIGTQTHAKAHALAEFGHEVFVLSHSADATRREYRDGAVNVIRIPGGDPGRLVNTLEAWWLMYSSAVAVALEGLHQQFPLDLVDCPEYGGEGFAWLVNRPQADRVPTVIQLHGPLVMLAETIAWPETDSELYRIGTFMEGTCLRLADGVFSSSACSAEWCARKYGLRRQGIDVIHTGIDLEHFSPRSVPKDERPTIVFVGRVAGSKGVAVLVEAALRLVATIPELRLRLIGRGEPDFCARIVARAASSGHPDLVELVGFVSQNDLPVHLSRAHVFAAPSLYEGGPGFVYLEAMACGLPVIACSGSGAAEVVVAGENGLLVPPDDAHALAQALDRLLGDAALRERMSARARQFVVDHADTRECLRRIEAFYRSVVASAGRSTPVLRSGGPSNATGWVDQ